MTSKDWEQLELDLEDQDEEKSFLDKLDGLAKQLDIEFKPIRFAHEDYIVPIEDYTYPTLENPCLNCPHFGKGPCNCIVPYLYWDYNMFT